VKFLSNIYKIITFIELNATSPVRFPEELLICNTDGGGRKGGEREEVANI
jgi:hypothetical protein